MSRDIRPLEEAARALACRDHSAADLVRRLERRGIDSAEAAAAVDRLEAAGYVDDARLALRRAEALAERGWGDDGIRHDLERRGVPTEAVDDALALLEPERERARRVAARLGSGPGLARKLASRGFAEDSIEAAVVTDG